MTTIALCMITKNEEAVIKRALDSVADLVNEIWIADSGSTDKTLEILKDYDGINILHYKEVQGEPFNYGRARNFAQSKTKADVIFSLDADEWLHPKCRDKFRENVERHIAKHTTLLVPLWTHYKKDTLDSPNHVHSLVRLFRNTKENVWIYRIHEVVPFKVPRELVDDIIILHDKTEKHLTMQQHKDKVKGYVRNLQLMIKEEPDNPRGYFYLLQTYCESNQHQKAIDTGLEYMKISLWYEERAQACLYIGKSYIGLGLYNEAECWYVRATIEDPARAEPWCSLGDLALTGGKDRKIDWTKSIAYFKIATTYQDKIPPSCLFLEKNSYEQLPWYRLSVAYARINDYEQGALATKVAMKYIPKDKDMINNLSYYENQATVTPDPIMPISGRPVNIVIPTRNKEQVDICLESIREAKTFIPFQVTIVWDKTGENTDTAWIEDKHYEDDFIFARNINRGFKKTCDNIILNDDTKVKDYWLDELQAAAYHGDLGIVSPLITDVGNINQHVTSQQEGVLYTVEPHFLCFVCAYIPLTVLCKVGNLDEDFIWYGYEDNDYCERVKNNGFLLKISHRTFIEHSRHSTYGPEAMKKLQQAGEHFNAKWKDKKRITLKEQTVRASEVITKEEIAQAPGQPKITPSVMIETFGQPNNIDCGENVEIRHCTYIEVLGGKIDIGKDVVIGAHNVLQGNGNITIGDGTLIGPHCNILSVKHPTDSGLPFTKAPLIKAPIIIGKNCWLGAAVTVMPGVVIGDDCIIGAHSLVTKDVPDGSIAVGTPAKVTRLRNIPRERQAGDEIEKCHLERYQFAHQHIHDGHDVLDACCGTGYGSEILIGAGDIKLTSVDISASACGQARHRLAGKAEVILSDILDLNGKSFDRIVCFEALEHMIDDERVLTHLWSLLKVNGQLICSVPTDKVSSDVNPHHIRHYSKEEFEELIALARPFSYSVSPQFRVETDNPQDEDADFWIAIITKGADLC